MLIVEELLITAGRLDMMDFKPPSFPPVHSANRTSRCSREESAF
jgi:hypothetical protein